MTGFAGDRVWVPELRGRGMLWVVLWRCRVKALRCA